MPKKSHKLAYILILLVVVAGLMAYFLYVKPMINNESDPIDEPSASEPVQSEPVQPALPGVE